MHTEAGNNSEEDEMVIALSPAQLGAVLAVLVVVFVFIRARRAR